MKSYKTCKGVDKVARPVNTHLDKVGLKPTTMLLGICSNTELLVHGDQVDLDARG